MIDIRVQQPDRKAKTEPDKLYIWMGGESRHGRYNMRAATREKTKDRLAKTEPDKLYLWMGGESRHDRYNMRAAKREKTKDRLTERWSRAENKRSNETKGQRQISKEMDQGRKHEVRLMECEGRNSHPVIKSRRG